MFRVHLLACLVAQVVSPPDTGPFALAYRPQLVS